MRLSVEDGLVYDKVKGAILRVYELVPEAYQQRFRNLKKMPNQTFTDFAREKTTLFDRWCAACKVKDLNALRELCYWKNSKTVCPIVCPFI